MNTQQNVFELWIGKILLSSIILALTMIIGGGIWYLSQHAALSFDAQLFQGESAKYTTLSGVLKDIGSPLGLIQSGLLLIIAGQIFRVAVTGLMFYRQRDGFFSVATTVILAIMIASFCS